MIRITKTTQIIAEECLINKNKTPKAISQTANAAFPNNNIERRPKANIAYMAKTVAISWMKFRMKGA